jgi:hypothetical protein
MELAHLHLSHTSPFDVIWVGVLLVTSYFTTVTAHTSVHVKVKTVLFPLAKVW